MGQLSAMRASIPASASCLMDWVAKIMAALCLRHVFCASVTYSRITLFLRKDHASSMRKALKVESLAGSAISFVARCRM